MFTFIISSVLLKLAGIWVRCFNTTRLFRLHPAQATYLPQHDPGKEARAHRIEVEREQYLPVLLTEKLGVNSSLRLKTVANLPEKERYPLSVFIPKMLIISALKIRGKKAEPLTSLAQLERLYHILGTPRIVRDWKNDSEFVRQRLQGINPVWIKRIEDPAGLLHRGVAQKTYAQLMAARRRELPLYVVNFHELLQDTPSLEGRYLAPAIAFFEGRQDGLHPLGIQLFSQEHGAVWFRPDGSPGWTLAKMFFNSADLFVHESLTHLLWTHLYLENFWMAAVRTLSDRHPVLKLLAPHFHFCLNANANSNQILLGETGIFETLFSAGRAGTLRLMEKGEALWTLERTALPFLFRENNTLDLAGYLYREDGLLIWQATEAYVREYLSLYYQQPEDLREDFELAAWRSELSGYFGPVKIPPIDSKDDLVSVLTAILFSVVQHTFVGGVQYEYIAYPPAMPPILRIPVPATQESVQEADILRALPTLDQIYLIMKATFAFSMQYTTLGRHLEAYHSDPAALAVIKNFQVQLEKLESFISERERRRQKPYQISRPRKIANSVSA